MQVVFRYLPQVVRHEPPEDVLVVAEGRHIGLDRRELVLGKRQEDAGRSRQRAPAASEGRSGSNR